MLFQPPPPSSAEQLLRMAQSSGSSNGSAEDKPQHQASSKFINLLKDIFYKFDVAFSNNTTFCSILYYFTWLQLIWLMSAEWSKLTFLFENGFNVLFSITNHLSFYFYFRPNFIRHSLQSMHRSLFREALRHFCLWWLCWIFQSKFFKCFKHFGPILDGVLAAFFK